MNRLDRIFAAALAAACALHAPAQTASRNLADPQAVAWTPGQWNSAQGSLGMVDERPPVMSGSAASLRLRADFPGGGFAFWSAGPTETHIPGRCVAVSVWVRARESGYDWALHFLNADGKDQVAGRKFEFGLKTKPGEWVRQEFRIPAEWKQPLQFSGIAGHNWDHRNDTAPSQAQLDAAGLIVEADISAVTNVDSLISAELQFDAPGNLFFTDTEPKAWLRIGNWTGRALTIETAGEVCDASGTARAALSKTRVTCTDSTREPLAPLCRALGGYRVRVDVTGLPAPRSFSGRYAVIPPPPARSAAQKQASFYGINVHGGSPVGHDRIARLGFAWVRDYAYSYEWMTRACGDDGHYAGWPWYPRLDAQARNNGLMVLPCLMGAVRDEAKAGHATPMQEWRRNLIHIIWSFPQYTTWELDNEYDLGFNREEIPQHWLRYNTYHRVFGEIVHFLNPATLAVENGTAGIHPERLREAVVSGAFHDIDVVNSHFYCGTEPPEINKDNANTGQGNASPRLLWDLLREFAAAGRADGRQRQAWVTEFGWDTLAVHIVSEWEQAAYLQRGYTLGMQAGLQKMFWYWNLDTKNPPTTFFDGCGLFDPAEQPKPAAAALSALVHVLPDGAVSLGDADLGPNAMARVFRVGNTLVACAFTVRKEGPVASVVRPACDGVFDLFGNPLSGERLALGVAPVWFVGLHADHPWVRQADFDIASRRFVRAVAGDAVPVDVVTTNRAAGTETMVTKTADVPPGWSAEPPPGAPVPAGGHVEHWTVRIPVDARAGLYTASINIGAGAATKHMAVEIEVLQACGIKTRALTSDGTLQASVFNNALAARSFVVRADVPAAWQVTPAEAVVDALPGGSGRDLVFKVTRPAGGSVASAPLLKVFAAGGTPALASAPIVPRQWTLCRADGLKMDGDLSDWPAAARLPGWMLGPDGESERSRVFAAWSPAGLHVAVEVVDSQTEVSDPKGFWAGDCLELLVDTRTDATVRKRFAPTDHQFWFCPLVKEGRVYAGRWKRGNEIVDTQYDIPGVVSACRKTADGYVMEFLLPAAAMQGFNPAPGTTIGLNVNLSVVGHRSQREVFWPIGKADGAMEQPWNWGRVTIQ